MLKQTHPLSIKKLLPNILAKTLPDYYPQEHTDDNNTLNLLIGVGISPIAKVVHRCQLIWCCSVGHLVVALTHVSCLLRLCSFSLGCERSLFLLFLLFVFTRHDI
jgi:hypothetical protein